MVKKDKKIILKETRNQEAKERERRADVTQSAGYFAKEMITRKNNRKQTLETQ